MKRPLKVTLSEFVVGALAPGDARDSAELRRRSALAIRFYLHESGEHRPGWSVPPTLRRAAATGLELELELEPELLRALEDEAGRQGVSVSRLVSQAAIYYAAELDAGRVTQRLLENLDGNG